MSKITTSRLEAFSDGVIAIIVTIMVLQLTAPAQPTFSALLKQRSGLCDGRSRANTSMIPR